MSTKKVLLIDDEEHIREVAQLCLEMVGGWDVLTADSGSEGLIKAEVEQPDVILLDMMMPEMDGSATFQHLQANPSTQKIPVILLTAKMHASDQRQFAKLGVGVIAVISKPFDPMILPEQVAEALGWNVAN